MSTDATSTETDGSDAGTTGPDPGADEAELAARIELLEAENRRLREEYARARRSNYRRTAIGMAAIGAVALLGALAFPANATVLVSLAAVGFFGGLLTYYLTPERFVAAAVGEATARTHADGLAAVAADVGLSDERVYVPGPADRVRLFVPQHSSFSVPADPTPGFRVGEDPAERGLVVDATGEALFGGFERALDGPLGEDLPTVADQLGEGLVEVFELVDRTTAETDGRTLRMGVAGSALGPVDGFDHPVASFAATGLVRALDEPVSVDVVPGEDRHDAVVVIDPIEAPESED